MSSEFAAAILGALVGAVVGGLCSLGLQLLANRWLLRQQAERDMEMRRSVAFALLYKVVQIHSNLAHLGASVEAAQRTALAHGAKGMWQFTIPISNLPAAIVFTAEEMAVVLALNDNAVFNNLLSLDNIHNSAVDSWRTYGALRQELTASFSADMTGLVRTTEFTQEEFRKLGPKMAVIDDLLRQIFRRSSSDAADAWSVLTQLQRPFHQHFQLTPVFELIPPAERV